jgi:hypothetical protein
VAWRAKAVHHARRIEAAVTALYWDRRTSDAWARAHRRRLCRPDAPTIIGIFRRVPAATRPLLLTKLISMSGGTDRLGNMRPHAGTQLRRTHRDSPRPTTTSRTWRN